MAISGGKTTIVALGDIVSVLRGTETTDEYNSAVIDWTSPTVVAQGRATVQNFSATEDDVDRQTTSEGWRLISDDPALFNVIEPTDRILYNNVTYRVNAPASMYRLFNRDHHVEVFLDRVVG